MKKFATFDQNHGLTPLEKSQFFDFFTSCFYSQDRRFFLLAYRATHFLRLFFASNEKMEKVPNFDQTHRLTP